MSDVENIFIEDEMKQSYINYAMSVIRGRAIPDVRDGLKPVQKRILFGMHDLGLYSNRPQKKSARIIGEVLGKYHPHGDQSVYDAMAHMAQDFSYRYPLVDGQGNFGSIDGDAPAAMRYTEARMSALSDELLEEINENTVDWVANFDDSLEEPAVLPAKVPTLMLNGSWGISVGMTTRIPPHNLTEVVDAILHLIDNDEATVEDLMKFVTGPDFPTGGIVLGTAGIQEAYLTGRGKMRVRGRAEIDDTNRIIITEIPFQVRKSTLVETIADKVKNGIITEISDLRDESDRTGIRVVIDLKRASVAEVVLNKLYKYTPLETTFGSDFLVIKDNAPKRLSLKQMLSSFLEFRRETVRRRTQYRLDQAEARAHILEGLLRALENKDEIVDKISKTRDPQEAQANLQAEYDFSEIQAQSILQIRLRQFTGMETEKLQGEFDEKQKLIKGFKGILGDTAVLDNVIKEELGEIRDKYGDERRTTIDPGGLAIGEIDLEALIPANDIIIGITGNGYVNAPREDVFRKQNRGGKGVIAIRLREKDTLQHIFKANTHDHLLVFTDANKAYKIRGFQLPSLRRDAKGENLRSLIEMGENDKVSAFLRLQLDEIDNLNATMITTGGIVNRNRLKDYANAHTSGILSVNAVKGDSTVQVRLTSGNGDLMLFSEQGQAIRFKEDKARCTSRPSKGVRGMRLNEGDRLISFVDIEEGEPEDKLLLVTQFGFGKRTKIRNFEEQGRGGKGVLAIKTTKKTGHVVAAVKVKDGDELLVTTRLGKIIRFSVDKVRVVGRYAKGVNVIDVDKGDEVAAVVRWEAEGLGVPQATDAQVNGNANAEIETKDAVDDDSEE
jgi:DNA gyrase subunit A